MSDILGPMKAVFCHDTYYTRDEGGNVHAYGAFPYRLWEERFLPHFDEITIIGRERRPDKDDLGRLDVSSGSKVGFTLLPNINTPFKRLFGTGGVSKRIAEEIEQADALIIRGPVEFGMIAAKTARKLGKPYAVEMSGCAFDHTWYHGSLLGRLYAPVKYLRARHMVKHADRIIYVTKHFLQRRYPTFGKTEYASNVEIDAPDAAVLEKRLNRIRSDSEKLVFGLIGNFGNNLKGLGVALAALDKVKDQLPPFEFRVLGKGPQEKWNPLIERYGLGGHVIFSGTVPGGQPVLDWLDDIDIYLQPSFHEGLPRGLIEAMSRGCPALASDAGGTDELLAPEHIHRRGDINTLARHILLASEPGWQEEQAQRNFEIAKEYTRDVLAPRRQKFWAAFKAGL